MASAVPKMAEAAGSQAMDEEQRQACSMPTCLEASEDSEEAEVVVETLLLMELADLGSLDKYIVHARLKHNRVSKSASAAHICFSKVVAPCSRGPSAP